MVPRNSKKLRYGLSKSKITAFEQCSKRLWLQKHKPDAAEVDEGTEARFAAGNAVGEIACQLCIGGVMIEAKPDLKAALDTTQKLLNNGHDGPMFEATFDHDGVMVRADIMEPTRKGAWNVAEVKSSTRVKDYHLGDMATQIWVLRGFGLSVASASIRHINNKFELQEADDYEGLLIDTSVDEQIEEIIAARSDVVAEARKILAGDEPAVTMGDQCNDPFTCEFQSYCYENSDAEAIDWPISLLPRTGKKMAAAYGEREIFDLTDVPEGELTHKHHEKIRTATVDDEPFHDTAAIIADTDDWEFPLVHLDFESCNMAIPRWIETKPYQQIPFQFSAHIQPKQGKVEHIEFLDLSGDDPRRDCAEALSKLPEQGSVVAWYAPFERSRLQELAAQFPEFAKQLDSLVERLVDLKVVAENHYYHRDQRGSWSLKNVLPTLAKELDYSTLEVKAGGEAVEAYEEAIAPETSPERKEAIEQALKAYCARDTYAMVVLLRKLRGE